MKIVAKTRDSFLIEADENEISQLQGFASSWSMAQTKRNNGGLCIGEEIKVSAMYERFAALGMQKNQIEVARAKLQTAIQLLDPFEAFIAASDEEKPMNI